LLIADMCIYLLFAEFIVELFAEKFKNSVVLLFRKTYVII